MIFTEDVKRSLSSPISSELPCGKYLKTDRATFRPLRNEFNVAQTALRKLAQNPDEAELDNLQEDNLQAWKQLGASLKRTFETESRDIELIGWMLAVQLIVDNSVDGASNLIAWLNELVENEWESLNPVLPQDKLKGEGDEAQKEQFEAKVKAFFQICGDSEDSSLLYAPLLMLPLVGDITFFQYQSAENKGGAAQLRQQATQALASQKSLVQARTDNLAQLSKLFVSVSECVNKHTQPMLVKGVNFTFALSLISKVQSAITYLTGLTPTQEHSEPSNSQDSSSQDNAQSMEIQAGVNDSQSVSQQSVSQVSVSVSETASFSEAAKMNNMNRDQAFVQLRELAEYFRVSEPHSPVSFLLEKAIRWGYMPLPELMSELLVGRENDQDKIFNLIGLDNEERVVLPEMTSATTSRPSSAPMQNSVQENASHSTDQKETPKESSSKSSSGSTGLRW
ncbi:type VI secretion system ImpA family N-terminal domain-containing protein [Enterovibrio makurazakiensis]|uniref:type VI secretion system protein TssA n=1 Tax=Enterovibrio makurazakiensis TaxID=2910232 RepID=UPI003D1D11B9